MSSRNDNEFNQDNDKSHISLQKTKFENELIQEILDEELSILKCSDNENIFKQNIDVV
jgi:hypothetical protein